MLETLTRGFGRARGACRRARTLDENVSERSPSARLAARADVGLAGEGFLVACANARSARR